MPTNEALLWKKEPGDLKEDQCLSPWYFKTLSIVYLWLKSFQTSTENETDFCSIMEDTKIEILGIPTFSAYIQLWSKRDNLKN